MRLTLICHAATTSARTAAFPTDEPVADLSAREARLLATRLRRADRAFTGPALRARQTAAALDLHADVHPALDECDYGRWRGLTLAAVEADDPRGIAAWLSDPLATPHGGESRDALLRRVAGFMDSQLSEKGHTIATTHASVIRAAVVHALDAPQTAFWRIDVSPLSLMEMSSNGARWALRACCPIATSSQQDGTSRDSAPRTPDR